MFCASWNFKQILHFNLRHKIQKEHLGFVVLVVGVIAVIALVVRHHHHKNNSVYASDKTPMIYSVDRETR